MVHNHTPKKAASLKNAGARVVVTPKEVADWAEVIILTLTGPEAIDALLSKSEDLLAGKNNPHSPSARGY